MIGRKFDRDHDDGKLFRRGGHAAKLHRQAVLERAQVRHGFQQFDAGLPASLGDLAAALDHLAPQLADGGVALPQIYR